MPKYLLTIREIPNTSLPGRYPSSLQYIPESRIETDKINFAFNHTSIQRDDFANTAVAAISAAILANGGSVP